MHTVQTWSILNYSTLASYLYVSSHTYNFLNTKQILQEKCSKFDSLFNTKYIGKLMQYAKLF